MGRCIRRPPEPPAAEARSWSSISSATLHGRARSSASEYSLHRGQRYDPSGCRVCIRLCPASAGVRAVRQTHRPPAALRRFAGQLCLFHPRCKAFACAGCRRNRFNGSLPSEAVGYAERAVPTRVLGETRAAANSRHLDSRRRGALPPRLAATGCRTLRVPLPGWQFCPRHRLHDMIGNFRSGPDCATEVKS